MPHFPLDIGEFAPRMRAPMHPNYRNRDERSATALPQPILSNRRGTPMCAADSLDEAVMR